MDTYLEPQKDFVELRDMVSNGTIDLLREFSTACREEFEHLSRTRSSGDSPRGLRADPGRDAAVCALLLERSGCCAGAK